MEELLAIYDVLLNEDDIGDIPAGQWFVVKVGFMATLSRLGED